MKRVLGWLLSALLVASCSTARDGGTLTVRLPSNNSEAALIASLKTSNGFDDTSTWKSPVTGETSLTQQSRTDFSDVKIELDANNTVLLPDAYSTIVESYNIGNGSTFYVTYFPEGPKSRQRLRQLIQSTGATVIRTSPLLAEKIFTLDNGCQWGMGLETKRPGSSEGVSVSFATIPGTCPTTTK